MMLVMMILVVQENSWPRLENWLNCLLDILNCLSRLVLSLQEVFFDFYIRNFDVWTSWNRENIDC